MLRPCGSEQMGLCLWVLFGAPVAVLGPGHVCVCTCVCVCICVRARVCVCVCDGGRVTVSRHTGHAMTCGRRRVSSELPPLMSVSRQPEGLLMAGWDCVLLGCLLWSLFERKTFSVVTGTSMGAGGTHGFPGCLLSVSLGSTYNQ